MVSADEKRGDKPTAVRIPPTLRQKLNDAATENRRSLNAEIITRLAVSFDLDPTPYQSRFPVASETASEALTVAEDAIKRLSVLEKGVRDVFSSQRFQAVLSPRALKLCQSFLAQMPNE